MTVTTKFIVEIEANAPFQIGFACNAISEVAKGIELWSVGYSMHKPEIIRVKTKSYNATHRRKLIRPAIYGRRK